MIKLSDYVLQQVAAAGTKHVFLVPGGAAMHLNDSLGRMPELEYIGTFHEHAAAVAAEAYSKLTNGLGVAMVTAGPGSTNVVTGVATAWVNSAPLLILSGQVKTADLNDGSLRQCGLQEIDIVSIVAPITKYAVTVTDASTVRFHMEKALHLACTGRPGPVWICIPLDVQAAMIEPENQQAYQPETVPSAALSRDVAALIDRLNRSERPVLLAGGGIRISGAQDKFLELVDVLGIPVQTTWVATDAMAYDHPQFAGRPGSFASRGANFTVQNSDFLFALGARFDFATTGYSRERFARAAQRVAVDVDATEIEKMRSTLALGIVASAADVIDELLANKHLIVRRDRSAWIARVHEWMRKYPIVTPDLRGRTKDVSTYVLVEKLSELLRGDDTIVEGSSGIHSEIFFLTFDVKRGQRVLADGSFGSMGYGVPAAIGACIAAGRRRTILVDGDGSVQPNLQELATLARERLPLKIIVVNNRGYSSIRASQGRYFQRLVGADAQSGLALPELSKIAAAYGIRSVRIEHEAELDSKMREGLAGDDPVIIDVLVPIEEDRVPRLANIQKPDGTMVSKPMEDMFPFLDRAELIANMIIEPLPEE